MRRALAWIASLCLLAGLVVLGIGVYKAWDPFAGARQTAAQRALSHTWGNLPVLPVSTQGRTPVSCQDSQSVPVGTVFGLIQIPAFGPAWKFTIIQGTTLTQLATGPGHILGTVMPGQAGDMGIAAHDVTAGNPFLHLVNLTTGDKIIVTTARCVTTYQVYRPSYTVYYTDTAVLNAVGGKHTITLVTCTPVGVLYFVTHRTIVQGVEISSVPR